MFDRWREWLKVIGQQLDWLLVHRSTFRKFISSGPNADTGDCSDLIDLIRDGYIAFTGTTIRKMAQTGGNQSISLGILLQDLKVNIGLLKRGKFLEAFPGSATARHNFDKVAGSVEASEIPASVIDDDLARLRQICKPAADFADKVLVHTDRDQAKVADTCYGQLDKAIDCLLDLFQKYCLLLSAHEYEAPPMEDDDLSECLKRLWN